MYDGDIRVFLTEDGAEIFMENGNILMDQVVFNAISMSIFSGKNNDHHNLLMSSDKYKLESKTVETCNKPITLQSIGDIKKAVKYDLKPLIDDGIIYDLLIDVKNITGKVIEIKISCSYTGGQIEKTFVYNNGILEVK